ncbi:MAG: hypothetical protein ACO1OK_00540 [Devosia sp.]
MNAAIAAAKSNGVEGVEALRALEAEGLQTAGNLADIVEMSQGELRSTDNTAIKLHLSRVQAIWAGVGMIPPPSAGNTFDFIALQMLPHGYDDDIADWVDENFADVPPVYAFEVQRRLVDEDIDSAAYWFLKGGARLQLDQVSCPSEIWRADFRVMWLPYAGSEIRAEDKVEQFTAAYEAAFPRLLANWDDDFPVPSEEWQACARNVEAGETAQQRQQRLLEAREQVRLSIVEGLAKRASDQPPA